MAYTIFIITIRNIHMSHPCAYRLEINRLALKLHGGIHPLTAYQLHAFRFFMVMSFAWTDRGNIFSGLSVHVWHSKILAMSSYILYCMGVVSA